MARSSLTSWKAARRQAARQAGGLSGYPEKSESKAPEPEPPTITEADLAKIKGGTQVFHKSFGYGEVIAISSDRNAVCFDNDKKKIDREFMFPSTFHQGMLQL